MAKVNRHDEGGMKLHTERRGEELLVLVEEARLDAAVSMAFKDQMRQAMAAGGSVVALDLSRVDFMDSSGLGALIAVLKGMPHGRRLELQGLRPNVERVLRLTRMDSVFTVRGGPAPQAGAA